ncbi:hypothetical protein P153DRAFT_396040 [Dothidotthia symphoricarpi CBS 119687]|uniref:IEC3 subunit of the Ino80 complex, chromatin re-modelling-domain-containing protein n=1 Tax=Dothidotthia symphoricarpi CBS 119687 TaxID=1392245 RepID=A0A6A6AIB3_9PLEO|nr:uncharacterized protein P153DRAFT_396040 [Dothidotthia symphoricarpi CBS 119687]KAF2130647.1 hypothetical protein P153DRAFT_396040 [Dothidotthia symphoricarpi CBS 119687]
MASEAPPQLDEPAPDAHAHHADSSADAAQKQAVKRSWRRKFRKMRIQFDNAMSESNRLIMDEWKAMGTARRLQQENDQLLDALLDFNDQPRVAARHRFDLRDIPHYDTALPSLEPAVTSLPGTVPPHTIKSLATLEARVPHTARHDLNAHAPDALPIDLSDTAPGYMSPAHEEENLLTLDQTFDLPDFDTMLHQGRLPRVPSSHPPLSEKDLTVRNPDSVYSWLRKHQPQVFLQDKDAAHHDNMSEKAAPKTAAASSRKGKRESVLGGGTPGPRDHDDEDSGLAPETAKGRRKTGGGAAGGDDDTAYRPKGGSSRPAKRKREDGDPAVKSKKKIRPSAGPPAA